MATKINESLVKYLAGLLDADGSLSFTFKSDPNRPGRHFVGLTLSLASSDAVDKEGFTESLPTLTGMGSVHRYGAHQQFICWRVNKRAELEMLLPRLTKHMVIKAQHWQFLLEAWRTLREDSATVSTEEMDALKEGSKESRRTRVGPLKPKNHPNWAWVAGYLDGDGCYTYRRNRCGGGYTQWTMHVSAVAHRTDMVSLYFLQKAFGGQIFNQGQSPDVFVWRRTLGARNRDFALTFLPKVAKFARLKQPRIRAMIHHHQQRLNIQGVPTVVGA